MVLLKVQRAAPAPKAAAAGQHCQHASRFPRAKLTGHALTDDDVECKREMAMTIIDHLVMNVDHAPSLHAASLKRIRLEADSGDAVEVFKNASSPKQLDEDFIVNWLARHSDMQNDEIVSAKTTDPDGPLQMFLFQMNFGPGLKSPPR